MKIKDVIQIMEDWAPLDSQEEWDNSGLQCGNREDEVKGVLISLDLTMDILDRAIDQGFNLIINHHPLIFSALRSIEAGRHIDDILIKAIKNDISIYAAHTNLDVAEGGVNDVLASLLAYDLDQVLQETQPGLGLGRYGDISEISLEDLAKRTSESLDSPVIYYGDKDMEIRRLAVSGGSGGSMIGPAIEKGCQAIITGDIKHHDYLDGLAMGIGIIDAGHQATEQPICWVIKDYLEKFGIDRVQVVKKMDYKNIISSN